jgi:hypothetical protein
MKSGIKTQEAKTGTVVLRKSCAEISVAKFRKAHCHNDLKILIISGEPTEGQLLDAWNEIVFELSGLIRTEDSARIYEMQLEMTQLQYHIVYVEKAVMVLRVRHSDSIVEELHSLGYPGIYDPGQPEERTRQLNRLLSLCKTKVYDLEVLQDEYDRLEKTNEGKKQSDEDFIKNIVMLKKWGYKIDMEETMMDEYAQAMNLYMQETKRSSKNENA